MAYDIGPKIGIEGDKAFKNALKAVNSQIKATAEELKTLSKEYDGNFSSIESASRKQEALANAMEAAKSKISLVTEEYKRQKEELTRLGDALEEAQKNFGADSGEALKAQSAFNDQATHVNNLAQQLENAKGKLADYTNQMKELGDEAKRAGERLEEVGEKVSGVGDKISNFGGGLEKAGGFLTKGLSLPLAGIGTAALKAGDDFEAGMSRVAAISGASENDLQRLTNSAMQLGADTKFSAAEVSEAMYYMAMAGWKTEEILAAVGGVLDLAAAGNTGLATASDIVTDAMTAFGYEAKDCQHFVDVLAAAATNSNTSIEEMGEVFAYVGAAAGSAGYSVEDVAWAIGILANRGIKGSKAATSLRSIMTRLATDMGATSKSLGAQGTLVKELKTEYYDSERNMRSFSDVIKDSREAWKGLNKEQGANIAYTIGGQDGYNTWMSLMDATDDEVQSLDNSLSSANGTAKRMADTMMNNVKGSLEEAKGSLETAGIVIQKQLAPYVQDAAGFVKDLANEFSGLDEKQQAQIVNAGLMAAAAGPALSIGGKVVKVVGDSVKGVGKFIEDVGKVKAAGGDAVDGVGGLAQVFGKLGPEGVIVTTAVLGLAAIGTAVWAVHENALKADIDGHFGDIYLSAKEVEDIATRLTTTEWTMKVGAVVDAKSELESIQSTLDGYKREIDKADWKVSIGLELSQGEIESYAGSIKGYVDGVQKYVEQHQYTVALAIDTTVGKDSTVGKSLETFAQAYYGEAQTQLTVLGEEVSDILNNAIANGTLDESTMSVIRDKLSQMSDIQKEIADMEFKGKLGALYMKISAGGYGLDYDSFKRLAEETGEDIQKIIEDSLQSQELTLGLNIKRYEEMVEAGVPEEFARRVLDDAKAAVERETQQRQGEAIQVPFNFGFNEIKQKYKDEMSALTGEISSHNKEFLGAISGSIENGGDDIYKVISDFSYSMPQASGSMKRVIQEFLENMEPNKQQLEAIRDSCIAAGEMVPESVQKGLSDIYYWEAISGDMAGKFNYLAAQIADNPELLTELQRSGAYIPEELSRAITANTGMVYDAATGIWHSAKSGAQEGADEAAKVLNEMGAKLPEGMAQSIAEQYSLVQNAATGLWEVTKESSRAGAKTAGKDGGKAYAEGAQGQLDDNPLKPKIDDGSITGSILTGIKAAKEAAQKELDSPPLTLKVVVEEVTDGVSDIVSLAQGVLDSSPPKTKIELEGSLADDTAEQADSAESYLADRRLVMGVGIDGEALLAKLDELFYLAQSDLDDEENLHAFIELHGDIVNDVIDMTDSAQEALDGEQLEAWINLSQEAAGRVKEDLEELRRILQDNLDGETLEAALELTEDMESSVDDAMNAAQGTLDWYGPLTAQGPEVDGTDMYNSTVDAWNSSQDFLDDYPLRATIEVAIEDIEGGIGAGLDLMRYVRGYADGGIVEHPQLAAVAEDGSEAIIPLEKNRARAQSLWIEAGRELNMFSSSGIQSTLSLAGIKAAKKEAQRALDDPPLSLKVETESAAQQVTDGVLDIATAAQGALDRCPLTARIEVAAEGVEESIARTRALMIETMYELNTFAADAARDRGYMASAMREAYENNSYDERMVFEEGSIVINTQAMDGGRLYEDFKRRLGAEVKRKGQAYGR